MARFFNHIVYYNDLALSAKNSITDAYEIHTVSELTSDICKRMISKQCNSEWQTRWDRSRVARTTYDLVPTVGRRLLFPDDKCRTVSYARLLLDDTKLKVHQHRYGIDLSQECECGHGIDDVQHFFLECERYSHIRTVLYDDIMTIWQDSGSEGSLDLTVSFLLAPYSNGKLTHQETHKNVSAVFEFECTPASNKRLLTDRMSTASSTGVLAPDIACNLRILNTAIN